jgi:NAD(P)-dependent dehydrogenase (short-subunit alcohol dehydrogenase family)
MNLSGRVALITGGAGHIGRAMVSALLEVGANVAILDLPTACAQAHDYWQSAARRVIFCPADLEDLDQIRTVPDQVVKQLGRLDILIHCAAFVGTSALPGWTTPFSQQNLDTWRRALDVNLTAAFVLAQASQTELAKHRCGSIINVCSIYGMVGPDWRLYEGTSLGNPAAYAASKGGLLQFTRWLATTLAPDIRVNAITPGGVFRQTPEPFHSRYVARTPLQRMATEEDFKGAVVYLASDLSAYVTGQNIIVDGGWTVW